MKTIVLSLLLFTSIAATSQQQIGNLVISDYTLKFQKIYETDATGLVNTLKQKGGFITNSDTSVITATFTNYSFNYRKYGYARMDMPMFLQMPCNFAVRIDLSNNRYRVTATNLQVVQNISISIYNVSTEPSIDPIEEYALNRKGELRWTLNDYIGLIDKDFTDLFTVNSDVVGEW